MLFSVLRCAGFLTVLVVASRVFAFQVFVKAREKTCVIHDVYPESTVDDFISILESKIDLERTLFWLVYAGKILSTGEKRLLEYGIQNLSTVFLHERFSLRRGVDKETE